MSKILLVDIVPLLGSEKMMLFSLLKEANKKYYRGMYIDKRAIDTIYAAFEIDDEERLDALAKTFKSLMKDYKTKNLVQIRTKIPSTLTLVEGA